MIWGWVNCVFMKTMVKFDRGRMYKLDFTKGKNPSLERLKKDLLHFFKNREEVLLVYIFGSCLRGKVGKNHDIDIAILIDSKIYNSLNEEKP